MNNQSHICRKTTRKIREDAVDCVYVQSFTTTSKKCRNKHNFQTDSIKKAIGKIHVRVKCMKTEKPEHISNLWTNQAF